MPISEESNVDPYERHKSSIHERDSPQNRPSVGVEKEVELERGPGETKESMGKSSGNTSSDPGSLQRTNKDAGRKEKLLLDNNLICKVPT